MKTIKLKRKNQWFRVLLDDQDWSWFIEMHQECNWHISRAGYVIRQPERRINGKRKITTQRLHRLILGLTPEDRRQSDHIDGNRCNNQRSNLRIVSNGMNSKNRITSTENTSPFIGVSMYTDCKRQRPWTARLRTRYKDWFIGTFETQEEAGIAYCKAAATIYDHNSYDFHSRVDHNLQLLGMSVDNL